MKSFFILLLFVFPLIAAEPVEISVQSKERKVLFDLLRAEVAVQAGLEVKQVKFQGSLQQQGKWAFFGGRSLDEKDQSLELEPLGNDDTCALFLKTRKGWVLVDWSAGHSDLFYGEWMSVYAVQSELLGLPKDWKK